MATYTLTDLPRELTEAEQAVLDQLVSDRIRLWDWETGQASHVCRRAHGGAVLETVITQPGGERHTLREHEHEPRCHDCGRGLHRPPGTDDRTWLCPNARRILPAGKPDTAVECGEAR